VVNTFKLIIDNREVEARQGETILEVARRHGIDIPTLCYDQRLKPYGGCRVCLVEIEGRPDLMPSCCTEAAPDMRVWTHNERVLKTRKTVVELLLSDHPNDCLKCESNGACELQRIAYELGASFDRYSKEPVSPRIVEDDDKAIQRDNAKCILCGRCVRICEEVQSRYVLDFGARGFATFIAPPFGKSLLDTPCVHCGQCVSTCPTGALVEKQTLGKGRMYDWKKTRSTCAYCGVGCQIDIYSRDNEIVKISSEIGVIPNDGNLCVKGRFGFDFVNHPDRLCAPLIKRDGQFVEVSWDEALDLVAQRLSQTIQQYGANAVAGLSSAKCTNEENYVMQKFVRAAIGTNNIDHCARLCHASTVAGLVRAFGSGAMTNSIGEIGQGDVVFVIGSNTTEMHPVMGVAICRAAKEGKVKLVVADPRRIDLVDFADIWVQQRCGTDVALLNGLMNVIIAEGLHDQDFIDQRTEGFDELKKTVAEYTPEVVERITGVPADDLRRAARLYAQAGAASIYYSMGITQHTTGTDNVLSVANLAMLTGNIGRPGTGVNPLRGQNNVQGACDLGALPNVYAGYQKVDDPEIQAKFEQAWGVKLSPTPGLTVVEMMNAAADGELKALYVMGENPMLSDPDLNHVREGLENLDFLVVQDIFLTETAQLADVVLPAASFAEKDGTFTNTERRIQRVRKAVEPPGQARTDWEIVCDVARRMGYEMRYESVAAIMEDIAAETPIYGGVHYDRLEGVGLQWPCSDRSHPGTPILHADGFKRGRGKFHAVKFIDAKELPDEEYPILLTTGRYLTHWHTGTMTRRSAPLNQIVPEGCVELNPVDAERLGVADGDRVEVRSRRGCVTTTARVTKRSPQGGAFMAFHFAEAAANELTIAALDPIAKIPEYKVCAVRVQPVSA